MAHLQGKQRITGIWHRTCVYFRWRPAANRKFEVTPGHWLKMKEISSNETSHNGNSGWPRTRVRAIALALLSVVGIYLCYRLAQPCIPSLVWAGALALIFAPLQRWIEAKVRRPSLAAAFSLIIIGLLVVIPATWFGQKIADQATSVPDRIQKQIAAGKWHMNSEHHPQ